MMISKLRTLALSAPILAVAAFAAAPAQAQTAGSTLAVSATVLKTCLVTPAVLNFGLAIGNAGATDITQTTNILVTCTAGTPFQIGLDNGLYATGTVRKMRAILTGGESSDLPYELYRDAGYTQRWGNTVNTDTVGGTGAVLPVSRTVYGKIPAGVSAAAGSYLDTVAITVTY